ncbi:unnamed protein product [Notodromas monacha]|uniref:F-box domain-containing protein n=1 Tax=Notodromas monacha TaxID=399045 RepID=A0A7R9BMM0_9CRUS|nr:unnamed protein product [Notodromas monacha]CAG0916935.1 unnamed protein product [Notodromas monacha]
MGDRDDDYEVDEESGVFLDDQAGDDVASIGSGAGEDGENVAILPASEMTSTAPGKRITTPCMTKYERARVLGARALQIAMCAPVMVELDGESDPLVIAMKELKARKVPLIIRRMSYSLLWLPEEVLVILFQHCDVQSLGRLSQCSRYFRDLISSDLVWNRRTKSNHPDRLFVSTSPWFKKRCLADVSKPCEKVRVDHNWRHGKSCARHRVSGCRGFELGADGEVWLHNQKRGLYPVNVVQFLESGGNMLGLTDELPRSALQLSLFRVMDDVVVGSWRPSGGLLIWRQEDGELIHENPSILGGSLMHCLDCYGGLIFCATSGGRAKLLTRVGDTWLSEPLRLEGGGVPSACLLSPNLTVGVVRSDYLVNVVDLSTLVCVGKHETDATMYTMQSWKPVNRLAWQDEHTFYDIQGHQLVLMDLRTCKGIKSWMKEYERPGCCIDADRGNLIVTGSLDNGLVSLWDRRCCREQVTQIHVDGFEWVSRVSFSQDLLYIGNESSMEIVDFYGFQKRWDESITKKTLSYRIRKYCGVC